MLLIDYNQVVISGFTSFVSQNKLSNPDDDLIKHVVLNTLKTITKKFKSTKGEVIICCDNKKYWRREVFPHYKALRKKSREKSNLDWNKIFKVLHEVKQDLHEHFPYKVIDVEGAEADDVIAVLTMETRHEDIVICSSDGDFKQLHKYPNVKQYNPISGIFIKSSNVENELKEKIIRGDAGDGLSNILSEDDCFVQGKRQSPITAKKILEWIDKEPEEFCTDEMLNRYNRNKLLISFDSIPNIIKESIIERYNIPPKGNRSKLSNYLIESKLTNLLLTQEEF